MKWLDPMLIIILIKKTVEPILILQLKNLSLSSHKSKLLTKEMLSILEMVIRLYNLWASAALVELTCPSAGAIICDRALISALRMLTNYQLAVKNLSRKSLKQKILTILMKTYLTNSLKDYKRENNKKLLLNKKRILLLLTSLLHKPYLALILNLISLTS
jgi:hypothetical protein